MNISLIPDLTLISRPSIPDSLSQEIKENLHISHIYKIYLFCGLFDGLISLKFVSPLKSRVCNLLHLSLKPSIVLVNHYLSAMSPA